MVALWFLSLMIFSQMYILLAIQTIEYGKRIQILHKEAGKRDQLAYSFFLHLTQIIAKNEEAIHSRLKIEAKEKEEQCYATIEKREEHRYTITITTINQKNSKTRYQGIVFVENDSFSIFPLEQIENNTTSA